MFITRAAFKLEETEREHIVKRLIESSYPGSHFFIMLLASAVIAAVGLILGNSSIIIGSMLVAPFLSPVLSLGLGITLADFDLIRRSLAILIKAAAVSIVAAAIVALFVNVSKEYNSEILSRVSPTLPYLYVAIAAGVAACFAIARPSFTEFIVGVAVSVALLPPIAVTGIGLSKFDGTVVLGSFQLFAVNLLGIVFASVVIFSLMGFYPVRKKAEQAIKAEEKKLEEEKNSLKNKLDKK
jgi:uncharacterized hydrophobic protein (TIGR00271 family)